MERNNIINFVNLNSYFDCENCEDNDEALEFSTRENGSVVNEKASSIDILEGQQLVEKLLKTFPNITAKLDVVDEWVLIFVSDAVEKIDLFSYTFVKDINNSGFSQSFDDMDALIKRYGDWIDVNWDEIKTHVESIESYPKDNFNGWYSSNRFLIKKAGESGNTWGYNFYIIKNKKSK
jgi:hypothetical protein